MRFFQRKTPRAKWIEYNEGMYFITICTHEKKHYFGTILNDEIKLSKIGKILDEELQNVKSHYPYVEVLQYVVMPNHFHALVNILDNSSIIQLHNQQDTARRVPTLEERTNMGLKCDRLPLLSTFIGGLKSAVTRQARKHNEKFAWQPRYHDHVIRNINDFNNISLYIENNVIQWQNDCFFN